MVSRLPDCQTAPEDLITLTAKFYQGPLLGIMEISQTADGWFVDRQEHTWPNFSFTHDHTLSTNRQTFVEVDLPLPYEFDVDLTLQFPNLKEGVKAERFLLVTRRETVGEGEEETDRFVRRVVSDISRFGAGDPNIMEIVIEPTPDLPQLSTSNNVIQIDLTEFQEDVIPEMKILIIPVRTGDGVPDIDNFLEETSIYVRDLLPAVSIKTRRGEEVDLSKVEELEIADISDAVGEAWIEQSGVGEFAHGIFYRRSIAGTSAGRASLGGWVSVSAFDDQALAVDKVKSFKTTFAHELGHNLRLGHPSDDGFDVYPGGDLGDERGWRMSDRKLVLGIHSWVNLMVPGGKFGHDEFLTQQYYSAAKQTFIRKIPVAASLPIATLPDFDLTDGRSVVLVGNLANGRDWSVFHESVVDRPPFPRETGRHDHTIRVIHLNSGTELYRTPLPVYEVAHGTPDTPAGWSVRLPAYEGAGLAAEILDRDGRVVFIQDLAGMEL